MNTNQKSKLIHSIQREMQLAASIQKKEFDYGDTLLALCFKSDAELINIGKFLGVSL